MSLGHAPNEPPHSCPSFDEAIEQIENARRINGDLREWGSWWRDRARELEAELEQQMASKENDVYELEHRVAQLEAENRRLEEKVDELQSEVDWTERVGPR